MTKIAKKKKAANESYEIKKKQKQRWRICQRLGKSEKTNIGGE